MPVYVAFLRGINVGGNNKIPMADLREMLAALSFAEAKTLLQSGNVAFIGPRQDMKKLEIRLEAESKKKFGIAVDYIVRDLAQLDKIVKANPFPKMAKDDPSHLLVLFLKANPNEGAEADLQSSIKGREVVKVHGSEAYVTFPDGIGTSKLTPTLIEKKLGCRATGRNWNTLQKLLRLAKSLETEE